ncbi:Ig-like domain-containing protein [Pseudoalteromonas sp. B193]
MTDNGVGNDTTPTIAGTSDAPQGSEVTIVVTDSSGAAQTMSATVLANGTWSIPVPVAIAEGAYTISASVSDAAGNDTTATGAGEIDTTAPTLVLTSPGSVMTSPRHSVAQVMPLKARLLTSRLLTIKAIHKPLPPLWMPMVTSL